MRKIVALVALVLVMAMPLMAEPEVKVGGLFYIYNFYWTNADFDSDTKDADAHFYMHGDINATVNFDEKASLFVKVGAWGNYGQNPVTGAPGGMEPNVHVLETYLTLKDLFNFPISFQIGKQRLLYGNGMVAFDGGEDGTMGAKLMANLGRANVDLFTYKLIENGGMNFLGTGMGAPNPDNLLSGIYLTVKPIENIEVNGYLFAEANRGGDTLNDPRWIGIRSTGNPVSGLDYTVEFTMLSGSYDTIDYKGQAYEFIAHYALPMVKIGAGYVYFSGDDPESDEYEGYFSALPSPFIYDGSYDGWVGFGPAFMLSTPYGFSYTDIGAVTDLNVINGNVAFNVGDLSLRLDVFKYATNEAKGYDDSKDLGTEIAVNFSYPLNGVGFGGGLGYWMPGKAFGEDLDPMIGTILYFAKGF